MKIIHKYVLREHAGPLLFSLSALTSLMLLNYIAKQLSNLVGKGLEWTVIAEFFVLSLPFTVAMTLPMAVLVSVLYAFSRLASENEITAMKANGISMRRLVTPILIGGAVLTLVMIAFNDQILPRTNHRLRALQGDIARKKPSFALREQIINEVSPGLFFLRTNHLDPATSKMRDVTIYDYSDQLRRHTIYADSGVMAFDGNGSDLRLTLYNGFIQEVPKEEPTKMQRLYYQVDHIKVPGVANAFVRDSNDTYKSDREMSVCELQREVARHERDYLRAFDRYNLAAAAAKKDPQATVEITMSMPGTTPDTLPERSRQRTLGRAYCDGLRFLEQKGFGQLTRFASGVGRLLTPSRALAQQGQGRDTAKAKTDTLKGKADTLKGKTDTLKAKPDTLKAKPDTLKAKSDSAATDTARADTTKRDSVAVAAPAPTPQPLPPGVRIVNGDTIYPGVTNVAPATPADSAARAPTTPGIAPSSGFSPTVPASVEMETQRSTMLSARAQMSQYGVEIHKKFAISVACIVFVLLGAPLALRFPRGGVGFVIGTSLIVFALYYIGLIAGESLADRNVLPSSLAMWAANLIMGFLGLVLFVRMERDSATARGGDASELLDALKQTFRRLTLRRATPRSA